MDADCTQILQIVIDRFRELCRYRQPLIRASGAAAVEVVHDMRVCIRRLRVALRLYQLLTIDETAKTPPTLRKLARKMRRLATKLGVVRDLDVQIALLTTFLAGDLSTTEAQILRRTIKKCQKQRPQAQYHLVHYLRKQQPKLLKSQTLRQLERLIPTTPSKVSGLSVAFLQSLTNFYQASTSSTASEPLHQLRIATKKLRYTLEIAEKITTQPLAIFIKPLKNLQEILGEIHDCDVTLQLLGFPEKDNIIPLPFINPAYNAKNGDSNSDLPTHNSLPSLSHSLATQLQNRRQTLVQQYQQFWPVTFDAHFAQQLTVILQPPALPPALNPPPDPPHPSL